jgi:hypothetical protein
MLPQLAIQLGFPLWHIKETVSELPMFADSFLRDLPQLYNIALMGTEF